MAPAVALSQTRAYAETRPDLGAALSAEALERAAAAWRARRALVAAASGVRTVAEEVLGDDGLPVAALLAAELADEDRAARTARRGHAVWAEGPRERYVEARAVPGAWRTRPEDAVSRMSQCGSAWLVTTAGPVAMGCGVGGCPECQRRRAGRRVRRELPVLVRAAELGLTAGLLTLTQRARRGESLSAALARWQRSYVALRGDGRPRRRWWRRVAGVQAGREWTWRPDRGWHVHGHLLVLLPPSEADGWAEEGLMWWHHTSVGSRRVGQDWSPITDEARQSLVGVMMEVMKYPFKPASMPPMEALISWRASLGMHLHTRGGAWHGGSRSALGAELRAARAAALAESEPVGVWWVRPDDGGEDTRDGRRVLTVRLLERLQRDEGREWVWGTSVYGGPLEPLWLGDIAPYAYGMQDRDGDRGGTP